MHTDRRSVCGGVESVSQKTVGRDGRCYIILYIHMLNSYNGQYFHVYCSIHTFVPRKTIR